MRHIRSQIYKSQISWGRWEISVVIAKKPSIGAARTAATGLFLSMDPFSGLATAFFCYIAFATCISNALFRYLGLLVAFLLHEPCYRSFLPLRLRYRPFLIYEHCYRPFLRLLPGFFRHMGPCYRLFLLLPGPTTSILSPTQALLQASSSTNYTSTGTKFMEDFDFLKRAL